METFKCKKGCCQIKSKPYVVSTGNCICRKRKAGVFIYNPENNKVLIVQSKGKLWGLPKGTLQYGETERECAIREVNEETGLQINDTDFSKAVKIGNSAVYFYIERDECELEIQDHIYNNDVNALGWIKPDCLEQCIVDGHIILNQHCRIVFNRFMNRTFSHSSFTLVNRHRKSEIKS
jgi:8-oxo-dGTP pyrophosphatase MutT (NUDIX family)